MNHLEDQSLDRMLRAHDSAEPDTADVRRRLDRRLEEMIATQAVTKPALLRAAVTPRRKRTHVRIGGVAAAAVAATTAVILLPTSGGSPAYASWTATPQTVAASDRDVAARECQESQADPGDPQSEKDDTDAGAATIALAERRGDYVAVLLRDQGPLNDASGFCITELKEGTNSAEVRHQGYAVSPNIATPEGFAVAGMAQSGDGDELISTMEGPVGKDVVGLTIHTPDATIEATVENGRFAAWWPGRAFSDDDPGPSGVGDPKPILTYNLTLADGKVITGAEPSSLQAP